jgi:2-polyprenyl-3-methyl-5-hydroxy-6-metoxy-1,4-benzoquinol methylase
VDANPSAIAYAQATFAGDRLSFQLGLLDELELPEASFDRASCLEIVEHVYPEQVRTLLADIARLLRPGGQLLLTTPNYRGLWPVIEWAADRFSSAAKMDAEQHVTHFHRKMLQQFVEQAGLRTRTLRTYSTLAPFVAPASERMAVRFEQWERRIDLPFGNLSALVAERPR